MTGAEYNYTTSILKYKIKNIGNLAAGSGDDSISTHIFKKNTDSRWEIFIFPEDTPLSPLLNYQSSTILQNELAPDASFNISLNLSLPRGEFMIVANVGKGIFEFDDYEKLIMVDGRLLPVDFQDVSTNNAALVIYNPTFPDLEVGEISYNHGKPRELTYKIKNRGGPIPGGAKVISQIFFKKDNKWKVYPFPDHTYPSGTLDPSYITLEHFMPNLEDVLVSSAIINFGPNIFGENTWLL